jgi:predicted permease
MRWWNRRKREQDIQRELDADLELETRERIENGVSMEDAQSAARRALGNNALLAEELGEVWAWTFFDRLRQDLVYALRGMRKDPGFTATAVLSLTLGIGANTAIFSLIDAVMLRSLPVRDPQRLVQVTLSRPSADPLESFTYPLVRALASQHQIFSGLCGFASYGFAVRDGDSVQAVPGAWVSGGYYATLGLQPAAGRLLTEDDDRPGAAAVAVITDDYWNRKFGRSVAAIGREIVLEGRPVVIVGVTPAGFTGANVGEIADITLPLGVFPQIRPDRSYMTDSSSWWLRVLARPLPGISREQAKARLAVVWHSLYESAVEGMSAGARRRMEQSIPEVLPGGSGWTDLRRQFRRPLMVLMTVVGLLLLIACANVANLLLARSAARQREIAVRLAIGASRARIIRQLMTEGLLLSVVGAAGGNLVAWVGSRALVNLFASGQRGMVLDVTPDSVVLAFTGATACVTGILFGLAPAFRGTATGPANALREKIAIARSRLAPVLVSFQVSVALLLLIAGGLFVRTLANLYGVDSGFRKTGVLVVNADGAREGYRGASIGAFYEGLLQQVELLPGVQSASYSLITPLAGGGISHNIAVNGQVESHEIEFNSISRGYFKTMGTAVLLGREFTALDTAATPRVAVVNQAFARRYLSAGSPLGQRLTVSAQPQPQDFTVVGVVADSIYESLRQAAPPTAYCPVIQREATARKGGFGVIVEVHVAGSLRQAAEGLRSTLQPKLPGSPVEVHALTEQVERALVRERLMATLAAGFGILGLALAAVGLYGLLAYTVARRTNEIGIRLALGAMRREVLWMVIRQVLILLSAGVAIGIPVAWACSQLVSSMLFGLKGTDPWTIGGATCVLVVAGLAAGFLPAWRASRVDPIAALRYE